MAARIYEFSLTVPAGTAQANPLSAPIVAEDNTLVSIELEIPPGHNGLTGTRVMKGDVSLVPWSANTWITANDYVHSFPVGDYLPYKDISIQGYNAGTYPHTFYYRFIFQDFTPSTSGLSPTEADALSLDTGTVSPDPLSPDSLLGADTTAAIVAGDISVDDLTPVTVPADETVTTASTGSG